MTWRTGLGVVDLITLQSAADLGAIPDRRHVKSLRLANSIGEVTGLGQRLGYELILDLASPWLAPIP